MSGASARPASPRPERVRAGTLPVLGPLQPRLVDRPGAAFYLGVSQRTIWNLQASGKLQAVKLLGRKALYDVRDLDAMVDRTKADQR